MRAQVHGMGLENAQLCAAIRNNDYYEQLVIGQRPDQRAEGPRAACHHRRASDGSAARRAWGYNHDWAELDRTALRKITVTEKIAG